MLPVKVLRVLLNHGTRSASYVVADNGKLRIVDPPRTCWGRRVGCQCKDCQREADMAKPWKPAISTITPVCQCDRPLSGDEGRCARCGKTVPAKKAA